VKEGLTCSDAIRLSVKACQSSNVNVFPEACTQTQTIRRQNSVDIASEVKERLCTCAERQLRGDTLCRSTGAERQLAAAGRSVVSYPAGRPVHPVHTRAAAVGALATCHICKLRCTETHCEDAEIRGEEGIDSSHPSRKCNRNASLPFLGSAWQRKRPSVSCERHMSNLSGIAPGQLGGGVAADGRATPICQKHGPKESTQATGLVSNEQCCSRDLPCGSIPSSQATDCSCSCSSSSRVGYRYWFGALTYFDAHRSSERSTSGSISCRYVWLPL
jgi:hypothetical protein